MYPLLIISSSLKNIYICMYLYTKKNNLFMFINAWLWRQRVLSVRKYHKEFSIYHRTLKIFPFVFQTIFKSMEYVLISFRHRILLTDVTAFGKIIHVCQFVAISRNSATQINESQLS